VQENHNENSLLEGRRASHFPAANAIFKANHKACLKLISRAGGDGGLLSLL